MMKKLKELRDDYTKSISPVLGPLSGGSYMSLSPFAAARVLLGSPEVPKKTPERPSRNSSPDESVPVEICRIPLGDDIDLEVKSYSRDDLLMCWTLRELIQFVCDGLETSYRYDPDTYIDMPLGDIYEFLLLREDVDTYERCIT